ncbi:MAG: CHAT domain-containing protein [Thermoanaerobaculia bacterium]
MRRHLRACLGFALAAGAGWLGGATARPGPAPTLDAPGPGPGEARSATLAAGETHLYRYLLGRGELLATRAEQQGADVAVRVLSPAGRLLLRLDSPTGGSGAEELWLVAEAAGEYRLEVEEAGAAGAYRLDGVARRPASGEDRRRAEATRDLAWAEELRRGGRPGSRRRAITLYQRAAAGWRSLGEPRRELFTLGQLARLQALGGEVERAAELRRGLLPRLEALGETQALAQESLELALNLRDLNQPEAALPLAERAERLFATQGERSRRANALGVLAGLLAARGEAEAAERRYRQAIDGWNELGDRRSEAIARGNFCGFLAALQEADAALAECRLGADRLPASASRADRAFLAEQSAAARREAGELTAARAELERALALRRGGGARELAFTHGALGHLEVDAGHLEVARRELETALALLTGAGDRRNAALIRLNLGWVAWEGQRREEAAELFTAALAELERGHNPLGEASAHLGLAYAERQGQRLEAASAHAETALARLEALRAATPRLDLRTSLFAAKQDYFALASQLELLLDERSPGAGHRARAFETSERARGRLLLDSLPRLGRLLDEDPQEGQARAEVAAAERRRQELLAQGAPAAAAEAELRAALARLRSLERVLGRGGEAPVWGLAAIQAELGRQGATLLEYQLGEEASRVWLVSGEELASYPLPPRGELEPRARKLHELLAGSFGAAQGRRAEAEALALGELLLGPVEPRLRTRRVLVVPEGALHLLPFAALATAAFPAAPFGARRVVLQAPSASAALWLGRESSGPELQEATLAVVADPATPRFEPLEDAAAEAAAILALVPPGRRLVRQGAGASRELVLSGALAGYDVLHFAAHGVLDSDHPELSAIALAPGPAAGEGADGLLRAYEVQTLHLRARLVTLSACRTALGREVRGEGPVGLAYAFFRAGAERLLVSLWPVSDRATSALMGSFYRNLWLRGLAPAEALQAAQQEVRSRTRWQAPYYWAGFVLLGGW